MNFAFLAEHKMKIREKGKSDKYLDHARGLKMFWNVTVILIVVGAVETVPKGMV